MVSSTDKPGLHNCPLSANRVDIEQVAHILSLACGQNPEEARIRAVADNLEQEVAAARKDERKLFVAIAERKVVGWARIRSHGPDKGTWWLAGIFVHPEHQYRGIGRSTNSQGNGVSDGLRTTNLLDFSGKMWSGDYHSLSFLLVDISVSLDRKPQLTARCCAAVPMVPWPSATPSGFANRRNVSWHAAQCVKRSN